MKPVYNVWHIPEILVDKNAVTNPSLIFFSVSLIPVLWISL